EATAMMAKLEITKYKGNKIKKVASTYVVILKRKTQNIRRHYYTICNKIHIEASFMNIDEKYETYTNKQSGADVNSILLRSPHDIQGDDIPVSVSHKIWLQIHNLLRKVICLLSESSMSTLT
ncbi:hypothetical protein A2U01_0048859, partial [Trifolium medium]|nr:hypothetical protein [Trifolium medium]